MSLGDPPLSPTPRNCASVAIHFVLNELSGGNLKLGAKENGGNLPSFQRDTSVPKAFQRNYCLRSIGSARRSVVEDYVASQLGHHQMADPRVQEMLQQFQLAYPEVDLERLTKRAAFAFRHALFVRREMKAEY